MIRAVLQRRIARRLKGRYIDASTLHVKIAAQKRGRAGLRMNKSYMRKEPLFGRQGDSAALHVTDMVAGWHGAFCELISD